jgi:hypothetical protein
MEADRNQHMVMSCPALRQCNICKEHRPQTDFYKVKRAKKDILGVPRISRCRQCEIQKYMELDPRQKMVYAARNRARIGGLKCTITKDDIEIPETCPVLGIPLFARVGAGRSNRDQVENSPSLDRIDNSKGYVPSNIAVISMRANMIKNNATLAELKAIVAYIEASQGA